MRGRHSERDRERGGIGRLGEEYINSGIERGKGRGEGVTNIDISRVRGTE